MWLPLLLVFAGIGAYLVRGNNSTPALNWMFVYDPSDFVHASFSDILAFFQNLRMPIPPLIALAEVASIKATGSTILVTRYGYRVALVATYAGAIALARTSTKRMLVAFALSVVFLYVTTIVHPGNPQDYDIFFPMCFLIYLVLLRQSSNTGTDGRNPHWFVPCVAGLFLSMAELSRPFMIYLMPLLGAGAYFTLAQAGRKRQFAAFMLPLLLISGAWHGYLLLAHGQITFSNNAGFNIARAWRQMPSIQLVEEIHGTPLAAGRWANINTAEHAENDRRLQMAQFQYWFRHPVGSLLLTFVHIDTLLAGDTAWVGYHPVSKWFGLYAFLVRLTSSLVIVGAGTLIIDIWRHLPRLSSILSNQDNILLIVIPACILFFAVGEAGEEARLLLSLLPFLATVPIYRRPSYQAIDDPQPHGALAGEAWNIPYIPW